MKYQTLAIAALLGLVTFTTKSTEAQKMNGNNYTTDYYSDYEGGYGDYFDGDYDGDYFYYDDPYGGYYGDYYNYYNDYLGDEDYDEGYSIIWGWLGGSDTLNKMKDPPTCIAEIGMLNMYAEGLVDTLTYDGFVGDFNDIFAATDSISGMLQVFYDSQDDCQIMGENWDWARIDDMIDAWQNPVGYGYHKNKDVMINGKNVIPYLKNCVTYFQQGNFYDFGVELGKASAAVYQGKQDIDSGKVPNGKPPGAGPGQGKADPKLDWAMKMGSQFATGFLYGSRVGGFDDVELYNCLTKEIDSDGIFLEADMKLKKALNGNDPQMAVEGLGEMIGFIAGMGMEGDDQGRPSCPMIANDNVNWDDVIAMFELFQDEATDFQYVEENDAFFFNQQDITGDVMYMIDSYVKQDYKKMGFLLGEVFDAHLVPDANDNGQINAEILEDSQSRMNGNKKNMFLY